MLRSLSLSLFVLAGGFALRAALAAQAPGETGPGVFAWGLFSDVGLALLLGLAGDALANLGGRRRRAGFVASTLCFALWALWLVFQYFYFSEFGTRPDQIVLDYVLYTGEVTGNVWESYSVAPLLALCVGVGGVGAWTRRLVAVRTTEPGWRARLALGVAGAALTLAAYWAPPPFADRITRALAQSGTLTLAEAAITGELDYARYYKTLPPGEALAEARAALAEQGSFVDDGVTRRVDAPARADAPNVVLVLAESLGRELTGEGVAVSMTPRFDARAKEGLLFTRVYATGTRTARGLEGALASFPPIPGNAIVRLRHQREVTTLATALGERGYDTAVAYGGSLGFDNMDRFLEAGGFQRLLPCAGCELPGATETSWGVADEFLFERGVAELKRAAASARPLFLTLLTVTNHRPFTFPEGRVEGAQRTREGAARYADWAMGRFFDDLEREGLAATTLVVVIGDHGPRSYTREKLPADAHRVPLLFWGAGISSARSSTLGSTIDVAPTLLGLLGGGYTAPFFGRDLRRVTDGGRAFIQDKRDLAMILPDGMVMLGFGGHDEWAPMDESDARGESVTLDGSDPRERMAIGVFETAFRLYSGGRLGRGR